MIIVYTSLTMADDKEDTTTPTAEETNDNDEQPKFTIEVHSIISARQKQHGLLQNNYANYRQYCTRRIDRLSHSKAGNVKSKLSHKGKTKREFRKVVLDMDNIDHVNLVLVWLVQAERAWAHAMELKGEYDLKIAGATKKSSSPSKIRNHFLRRLRKAVSYAGQLEELCDVCCDRNTAAEAKAYAAWMRGNLHLEVENWSAACEDYGTALAICRAFGSSDAMTLEAKDLFSARAEHSIDPVLKYCQYELKEGGAEESDILELMREQQAFAEEAVTSSLLSAKLEGIVGERLKEAAHAGSMDIIEWRGKSVPVSNESLRVALLKVNEMMIGFDEYVQGGSNQNDKKFTALLSAHDEAIDIVETDLQKFRGLASGAQVNARKAEQEALLGHVKFFKLKCLMKRNEHMVQTLRKADAEGSDKEESHLKRTEQITHLYDILLQYARDIADLPGGEEDDEFDAEARAHLLRIDSLRCYYIGCLYAINEKFVEARTVYDHAISLAVQAADELNACEVDEEFVDSMVALEREITGAKCRAEVDVYLASLSGNAKDKATPRRSLLERINDFDGGEPGNPLLAHVPPQLQSLSVKPTFLDVSRDIIEEKIAKAAAEVDANQASGKGLLGWLRG